MRQSKAQMSSFKRRGCDDGDDIKTCGANRCTTRDFPAWRFRGECTDQVGSSHGAFSGP